MLKGKKGGSRKTPKNLKTISNKELVNSPKTALVMQEVKSRVNSGKIKLPKGFDKSKSDVSTLMNIMKKGFR